MARLKGEITVAEFIEKLRELPQDASVVTRTQYGLCPVTACRALSGLVHVVGDIDALRMLTEDRASLDAARKKGS